MIFIRGNEWQVAKKGLISEKRKGNMQTKQPRFKWRLNNVGKNIGHFF